MPTSIRMAPGLTMSSVTKPGGRWRQRGLSAACVYAARLAVRLWQMVTVADAFSSSIAMGLPTMSERPSTTADLPAGSMPRRRSISITPAGVQGCRPGLAGLQASDVDGVESVDILAGRDGFEQALGVDVRGKRELDEDAVDFVAGV